MKKVSLQASNAAGKAHPWAAQICFVELISDLEEAAFLESEGKMLGWIV